MAIDISKILDNTDESVKDKLFSKVLNRKDNYYIDGIKGYAELETFLRGREWVDVTEGVTGDKKLYLCLVDHCVINFLTLPEARDKKLNIREEKKEAMVEGVERVVSVRFVDIWYKEHFPKKYEVYLEVDTSDGEKLCNISLGYSEEEKNRFDIVYFNYKGE